MDTLKKTLLDLVKSTPPKQLSQKIKKDLVLFEQVQSSIGSTISEKVFNILNPGQHTCNNRNKKKFNSLTTGYKFCGKTGSCKCAKESVSSKVSAAKQQYTDAKTEEITQKRIATSLAKYGVTNNAQTSSAKKSHAMVYANNILVKDIVDKVNNTKQQRYGTSTYNNPEKIKATFKEKASNKYWIEKYPEKNLTALADKDQLHQLYLTHSIVEIADMCEVHIQTVYKYLNQHNLREPFKSADEQEIVNFLTSLGITNIVRNSRKIIPSRKEIDIYLPDFNLAIEYNGVFWHHEDIDHITRSYHHDKFNECEKLGIQLITIFSNFWHHKKDIVKRTLINKLGLDTNTVYARKCQVVEVSTAETKVFLNANHIQGYTTSSIRYGLSYRDTLVAVMTFGKPRIGIGKPDDSFELIRFASSIRVVGGASKLLSHFTKHYQPKKIISYSDNEWSNGNVYRSLNFSLSTKIPPSYWYLKPREHKMYHRYNFAKHKLVSKGHDATLTERQITKELGLLKIWDCGKRKWELLCNITGPTSRQESEDGK